jgi:hypothetical protein
VRKTEVAAVTQEIRVVRAQRRQLHPERPVDVTTAQYLDGLIDGLKRALNVARQAKSRPGR